MASYVHVVAPVSQNPGLTVAVGGCQFGFGPSTCASLTLANPGAGHGARYNEVYRRCLPRRRPTPGSPRVDQTTCNLRCFVCVRVRSQKHCFSLCFVASADPIFFVGESKKPLFLRGFWFCGGGVREGKMTKNLHLGSLSTEMVSHIANIAST